MALETTEYHVGSFFLDVHIVTEDEQPLEVDTTGGYQSVSAGTVLVPAERGRYDIIPEPFFSDTFSKVERNEDGTFKGAAVEQTGETATSENEGENA